MSYQGFNELSQTKIQNAYCQIPNLSVEGTNQQVVPWSAAKHIHHSPDFGLDSTKYGMTQKNLDSIAKNGLINHIRDSGTTPNEVYIKVFQQRWKRFAEHSAFEYRGIETVMGELSHIFKHNDTRTFIGFKANNGESFPGYPLTKK